MCDRHTHPAGHSSPRSSGSRWLIFQITGVSPMGLALRGTLEPSSLKELPISWCAEQPAQDCQGALPGKLVHPLWERDAHILAGRTFLVLMALFFLEAVQRTEVFAGLPVTASG